MKIKISSIMKCLIILMILMQFSYFKLFGGQLPIFSTSYDQYPLVVFYLIMILVICFLTFLQPPVHNKFLIYLSLLICFSVFMGTYYSVHSNKMVLLGGLSQGISYLYALLAIPIFSLMVNSKWKFRSVLKYLFILGIGAYAIRTFISMYYGVSGTLIFQNIAEESAVSEWFRNDVLRVNPPFIAIFFIPLAYYLAVTTLKKSRRILCYLSIVGAILYTFQINQTRSLLIYQILTVAILFVFEKVSNRKKIIRVLVLLIAFVILVNTTWFNNLLDTFSEANEAYGGSTTARINAIVGFGQMYLDNPVFGFGFLDNKAQILAIGGNIADIGILGSIYTLGMPILSVYFMIFLRAYYAYRKVKSVGLVKESAFILGMTILTMMTGINIDIFYGIFDFAVPFYIAIIEYLLYKSKIMEKRQIWTM